jgi:2-deoxy-D-gluconate 3-dehydrogenase
MVMDSFGIVGKKAIVTGGSRGLGHGMAEGLLEAGAEVILFDRNPIASEVVKGWNEQGYKAHAVFGDLSIRENIENMFAQAMDIFDGHLDILICNAGVQRRHRCDLFPIEDWDLVLGVNLTAVFLLDKLASEIMIKQGKGKIINIASMNTYFGGQTIPAYAASKGGIGQLTRAFSNDLGSLGINVNAIAPGYMDTEMNERLKSNEVRLSQISARIPMHRWGTPEDMKGPVVFLASDASSYLNGAIIPVDGGYLGM